MSLSTLLEAAKFLEMQEQQLQHRATLESALATTVKQAPATTVTAPVTGHTLQATQGSGQVQVPHSLLQGGQSLQGGQTVTLTATQSKPLLTNGNVNGSQQPQTVVISSSNISSSILQGSISFAAPPTQIQQVQVKKEQDGQISSTTYPPNQRHRVLHNSFDIMNPLIIDESTPIDPKKIRQPPLVFRAGTREVHNKLEKHRRAHLKECFDILKGQLPSSGDEKKTSNLSILHSALRYIQALKRRERELEHEMERLAREKISAQQRLAVLKKEVSLQFDNVDFSKILPEIVPSHSVTSSSSSLSPIASHVPMSPHSTVDSLSSSVILKCAALSESDVSTSDTSSMSLSDSNGSTTLLSPTSATSCATLNFGGSDKVAIPILSKPTSIPIASNATPVTIKDGTQQVQTALSMVPVTYPVNQGLVLQKLALVPHQKGLTEYAPLLSTHFITTPQQLNGINGQLNGKVSLTQYVAVKPVVVVSTASPRPNS